MRSRPGWPMPGYCRHGAPAMASSAHRRRRSAFMIPDSSGRYSARTAHDHETASRRAQGGVMSLRFAMVTDTHVGMVPASAERLRQVYAAIARLAPGFVLHCGDITDTGLAGEYARYWQTVPAALRGRIRHVPGNHEVRWDPTAKGLYRENFGTVPYSFDAGGVHFTGFDPTQPLLEPGHCGAAALDWLDRDLAAAGGPALLFQHFPGGGEPDYLDDHAPPLDLIPPHGLPGPLA